MRYLLLTLLMTQICYGGAIAQWKMNDNADDSVVADSVGSATGTFYDLVSNYTSAHDVTGKVNNGLELGSPEGWISIADDDIFSPTLTPFSITAWVSLDTDGGQEFLILTKWEAISDNLEWEWKIVSDTMSFHLYDDGSNSQIGRQDDSSDYGAMEGSGFQFFAVTYDGGTTNEGIKLYWGDSQCDTADDDNTPETFTSITNTDADLSIGYDEYASGKAKGIIDNIIVWDIELTQSQIEGLWNNDIGTEEVGLTSYAGSSMRNRYPNGYRNTYRSRYNFE